MGPHCGTIPAHDQPISVMLDFVDTIGAGGRFRRDRWIDFVDAEGTQHCGGAMGASCDRSLGSAVAEIHIDDTDGFERRQGFGRERSGRATLSFLSMARWIRKASTAT